MHIEKLYNLYSSSNIIRDVKSWTMKCVGLVESMRESEGRDHFGYLGTGRG
jgi:hypothetical protein